MRDFEMLRFLRHPHKGSPAHFAQGPFALMYTFNVDIVIYSFLIKLALQMAQKNFMPLCTAVVCSYSIDIVLKVFLHDLQE